MLKRWLIFGIILSSYLEFAFVRGTPSLPSTNSISPAISTSPQEANSRGAAPKSNSNGGPSSDEHSIDDLRFHVEELQKANDELEKRVDENYPNVLEKSGADLATLLTLLTVLATVVGTIWTLGVVEKFKRDLLKEAFSEAKKAIEGQGKFVHARSLFAVGVTAARTAWEKKEDYRPTSLNYLAAEALETTEAALQLFEELLQDKSALYQSECTKLKFSSMNNFLFYSSLAANSAEAAKVEKYAKQFRAKVDFDSDPNKANTYILTLIVFCRDFARIRRKSTSEIIAEIQAEIEGQEKRNLTVSVAKELRWHKRNFAALRSGKNLVTDGVIGHERRVGLASLLSSITKILS